VRFSTLIIARYFDKTTEPRLRWHFFLTRRHAQRGELVVLSLGTDHTDSEIYVRATLHRGEQRLDLLHIRHVGFSHPINEHAALNSGFVCWTARFDCRNQHSTPARIPERIT